MQGRKGVQKKAFDLKTSFGNISISKDPVMYLEICKVDLKGSASGNDELSVLD